MKTITCPDCEGRGFVRVYRAIDYGRHNGTGARVCETCEGEGIIDIPTTQEDLDELGIPASADGLISGDDDAVSIPEDETP